MTAFFQVSEKTTSKEQTAQLMFKSQNEQRKDHIHHHQLRLKNQNLRSKKYLLWQTQMMETLIPLWNQTLMSMTSQLDNLRKM